MHGSDRWNYTGFYNDDSETAFDIDMLRDSKARVFNTVACYGARFMGYERSESLLLNSLLENGVLSYVGARKRSE